MPIEISCSNCQAILRVADEHAGKSARCPQCSTVIPIPLTPLDETPEAGSTWKDAPTQYAGGAAAGHAAASSNPYASPHKAGLARGVEAHRGPVILILGTLSLVCCVFIAIPAIIMANEDLRKMDQGTMNPDGRSLTSAGKIIGIVSLVMNAFAIVMQIVIMFFGAMAQPGSNGAELVQRFLLELPNQVFGLRTTEIDDWVSWHRLGALASAWATYLGR